MQALIVLIILVVIAAFLSPVFFTVTNLLNILLEVAVTAILAIGQTYIIILAEIDLSVGAVLGLSGTITAGFLSHGNFVEGLLIGLFVGLCAGLVNGLLVTIGKLPSFIATLGTMTAFSGLTLVYTQGNPISVSSPSFEFIGQGFVAGIPFPVLLMVILYVIFWIILHRSHFGRYVFATGGNEEASRLSGINVKQVKLWSFVMAGVLSAIAGFIITSRLNSAEPTTGSGLELDAIAAVILGGTSLTGGKGGLIGTVIGAIILGVLDNGMNLLNVSAFYQGVAKGVIILLAVLLDRNMKSLSSLVRIASFKKSA
ncbi:MAG: ribose ABC transporter permease [Bacillota bacterium]|nr:ribose ABC transporter permease [Bacillota bacterium]